MSFKQYFNESTCVDKIIKQTIKKFDWDKKYFNQIKKIVKKDYENDDICKATINDIVEIVNASGIEPYE